MFKTVLVANRGEIACRVITTLKRMGIRSVAVYSEPDATAAHALSADQAVAIGPASPAESYLDGAKILAAAKATGAEAIHPGYGFLSENVAFAEACAAAGIKFIGPNADQIRRFGLKHEARAIAEAAKVPLLPGSGLLDDIDHARREAARIGYPVMMKSTAGGGGIGLSLCRDDAALASAYESVTRLGKSFFKESGVFLEKFVEKARHVEVQIFGDGKGAVAALGERDCSAQRRNQKVLEETPAPGLSDKTRAALWAAAVQLGKAVSYESAGTVEFIYDSATEGFSFLEVNTRLQVEHPVTESVTGLDLVEWMIRQAAGEKLDLDGYRHQPKGHSIEARLYAEDPAKNFQPSSGTLTEVVIPEGVRWDGWIDLGTEVSPFYDPLLAKLIVHGKDRADALAKMSAALKATRISGIESNLEYLGQVAASPEFVAGTVSTAMLNSFIYKPTTIDVLEPGTYSSVQDYPGRLGYWDIGVPPSGPMDDLGFRLANRLVGNAADAAGIEFTVIGPTLRFNRAATIALGGADMQAELDGKPVAVWQPVEVTAGSTLKLGSVKGNGCRAYLAVRGGIDVPAYLGSRSTFALGQFGGHAGRPLRPGDVLRIGEATDGAAAKGPLSATLKPDYPTTWKIGVLYGPHGAPDFFTDEDIEMFFGTDWEVHYNSNRLGIRLNGPKPKWARRDGGEAGLHPSNIHDCEYAVGSINFSGDMPIILTLDGPSLGGFVCPATIVKSELWKVGQVKPGDSIRFVPMSFDAALAAEQAQDKMLAVLAPPVPAYVPIAPKSAIVEEITASGSQPQVVYRQAGDKYVLIEYGPNLLDLNMRFRVHALMEHLKANPVAGIEELSPGVRSLQIRFDSRKLPLKPLMEALTDAERRLPPVETMSVKSRVVHMPLAFEDSSSLGAIAKYQQSVRPTAPYLPSNIEFMRRINGLESKEQVRDIVFKTSYMILGLGDVYLGAPCAVPVDPRHRLMTSKYNPARTYTPEGAVGIGGVYMCIYGMDSPGGYQLIGRTVPIWNKFLKNPDFAPGEPWLLKFFDQVRFYPMAEDELTKYRDAFRAGQVRLDVTEETFSLAEHNKFLASIDSELTEFKARQKAAFDKERLIWEAEASAEPALIDAPMELDEGAVPAGMRAVSSDIPGNVWQVLVEPGAKVETGTKLAVIEAMKMEFPVLAPSAGTIAQVRCSVGRLITAGQPLFALEP